jgi:hypothetical protein
MEDAAVIIMINDEKWSHKIWCPSASLLVEEEDYTLSGQRLNLHYI